MAKTRLISCALASMVISASAMADGPSLVTTFHPADTGRNCTFVHFDNNANQWYAFNNSSVVNGTTIHPEGDHTAEFMLMAYLGQIQVYWYTTGNQACGLPEIAQISTQ